MALGTMVIGGLGYIANVTPGTPVQATATPTIAKQVIVTPSKATGVANTGNVYIGSSTMNRVTGAGVLAVIKPTDPPLKLTRGDSNDAGGIDLSTLYVDANTGLDGVLLGTIS